MPHRTRPVCCTFLVFALCAAPTLALAAATAGADPDVNKNFTNPALKVNEWVSKFEVESREVYKFRKRIVRAAGLTKGAAIADIGAGTGLFTFLFADAVGRQGQVLAVDISKPFLEHLQKKAKVQGRRNIKVIEGGAQSPNLPAGSVDRVFICDTYHHFEHPVPMLAAIARALRPGGQVILVDFKRQEGVSSEWTLKHVRAGEEQVVSEFKAAGFAVVRREDFLKDNYVLVFNGPATKP